MNTQDMRFVYLRDGKNDVTIAYRYDDERQAVEFNVARRNKKDAFVKATGREVASGRLEKNGGYLIPYEALRDFADQENDKDFRRAAYFRQIGFEDAYQPHVFTNPLGYRVVAAFFHSGAVSPTIQPYDKRTMYVITRVNDAGEHEGLVVKRAA